LEIKYNHLIQHVATAISYCRQRGESWLQNASGELLCQPLEIASGDANDTDPSSPYRGRNCSDGVWFWWRPAVHNDQLWVIGWFHVKHTNKKAAKFWRLFCWD
jgi:hypothetical protein